jgi:molybdopterin-guanine dinucleotide biosynthesis protein A
VVESLRNVVDTIVLSTNDPSTVAFLDLPTVPDQFTGRGPVAGIHAALEWALAMEAEGICCVPCDAPQVPPALFTLLIESRRDVDAVLPCSDGPLGYEPLVCWYGTRSIPSVKEFLESGEAAAHEFVARLPNVRFLPVDLIASRCGNGPIFSNINTRNDLLALQRSRGVQESNES